jgi:GPH family glycoside/pentoside/hexuronide:cation symporter
VLGWKTIALYGSPAAGPSLLYMWVLLFYMNFATDRLLIAPGIVGLIFLVSKLWDAISDPMAGYLSDRTNSRFGRRRSWMLASGVPISAAAIMMWAPPASLSGTALHIWVAAGVFLFYTAYTAYYVPHLSLGSELATDGNDRNRIFAARNIAYQVGLLLAVIAGNAIFTSDTARHDALVFAIAIGGFTVLSMTNAGLRLPSEPERLTGGQGLSLRESMGDVARNPHARILLFVFFIDSVGLGATGSMTPYAVRYIVKDESILGYVMFASFMPAMLSIPVWLKLARTKERHHLWMVSMGLACIGYGVLFFLDEGRTWLMYCSSLFSGTAMGCSSTLGHAIKADVIDHDEFVTGKRKDGSYFATLSFVQKLGSGVMVGVSGIALGAAGFVANAEQTETARTTILFFMGGAPFIGLTMGLVAMRRFKLTRAVHAEIRRELDARGASLSDAN